LLTLQNRLDVRSRSISLRWAFFLFGFPFVLLANDAFHFFPEEGPLSFLLNF
jgi:hypothetical protein